MTKACGPCREPRMVLIFTVGKETGPKKSFGQASPCGSELCCNTSAWGQQSMC